MIAISVSNDKEARALAVGYGALVLLGKMTLYNESIPTIAKFCPTVLVPTQNTRHGSTEEGAITGQA
jgi:hypothetical protein